MTNKTPWIAGTLVLAIGISGTWMGVSPYLFPDRVATAAKSYDSKWLEKHINYDSVSRALTDSSIQSSVEGGGIEKSDATLIQDVYNGYITVANTIRFYQNQNPVSVEQGVMDFTLSNINIDSYNRRYININTFEYSFEMNPDERNIIRKYTIIATRDNIFDWKVISVGVIIRYKSTTTNINQDSDLESVIDAAMDIDRENHQSTSSPVGNTAQDAGYDNMAPQSYMTSSLNIRCVRDGNSITCVNKNDDAFFCTQNNCDYDEIGSYTYENSGEVKSGQLQYGFQSCLFTDTSVRCNANNNDAEITSEYIQIH